MGKLLVATHNHGKRKEIQALLSDLGHDLLFPDQINLSLEVAETGHTYAENAALKATRYAQASGLLTLADDSGLEVAILGGLLGIRSARFAPQPGANDADRRNYLLEQLQTHPRPWLAAFHCTVAIAHPDGDLHYTQGECSGEIIPEERGEHGFGYDPVFLLPELGLTMAELSMAQKNTLSHRAKAIRAAQPLLLELLDTIK